MTGYVQVVDPDYIPPETTITVSEVGDETLAVESITIFPVDAPEEESP